MVLGPMRVAFVLGVAAALDCSSFDNDRAGCTGCVSGGECVFDDATGVCETVADSANCQDPVGITMVDDGGEACQVAGSYPFYCTEAEAIAASPEAGAHEMSGAWMPNGASPMIMDGTYDGDASECPCGDADGDHGDHGDHGDGDHDGDEEHHDDHDGHDHGEEEEDLEEDGAAATQGAAPAALLAAAALVFATC